jgi:predicted dehydrogenase
MVKIEETVGLNPLPSVLVYPHHSPLPFYITLVTHRSYVISHHTGEVMVDKFRWGILSTGHIAKQFARGLKAVSDAELLAVGSRSQESADAFGNEFNVQRCYSSYEALVADPDVEAIYVGTPHPMHAENTLLCLEAGKAVICEKPITLNARQAAHVIQRARESRLFLMEAMWTRYLPAMVKVRELVGAGAIGEVRMVTADFGFRFQFDPKHRLLNPELGGGALLDVGIYPVSFASMLLGTPNEISGYAHLGETGVDEQTAMVFKYAGGELALLSCAVRTETPQEAVIMGTNGMIKMARTWWKPERFTLAVEGKPEQAFDLPIEGNGYNYEAMEVMRCVRSGLLESPTMPLDESLSIMQTMDAVRAPWGLVYPGE